MEAESRFAAVRWLRFGRVERAFGVESFTDTDRLAVVDCPHCGAARTLEYREYMTLLRDPRPLCPTCGSFYRLYGGASARRPGDAAP
jgi:transposase-like protein